MLWIAFEWEISNYFGHSYFLYEIDPSNCCFWCNLLAANQLSFKESNGGVAGLL